MRTPELSDLIDAVAAGGGPGVVLAEGRLPSSLGVLFTATASTLVKFFHLHNTAATGETAVVYLRSNVTERVIGRAVLTQDEQADVIDDDAAMAMESGDTIEGHSTNASAVDFVITGDVST